MSYCLGIDTSNYTTSVALYSEDGAVLQQRKLLPVKKGGVGLRQSDAVFYHTAQFYTLYHRLIKGIDPGDITAVGVSSRPRPVDGSYMPCFSVGVNCANAIADTLRIPLYTFSHQEGHIAAALLSSGRFDLFNESFIAFHISGGTTEAVFATPRDCGFKLEIAAQTLDLNAGQAIDRVGVMLGLDFPCGRELERLALDYSGDFKVKPSVKGYDCCLSGLENLCEKMYKNGDSPQKVACFCIKYIEQTVLEMTRRLIEKYPGAPLLYAGGVMSDSIIRLSLKERFNPVFAEPEYSSDNAAGIACLAYRKVSYDKS